jgi:hypothetical protein
MNNPLKGIQQESDLSIAFFSPQNRELIQAKLRYAIFKKSGKKIDIQSAEELLTVMRAVYLQNSRNQSTDIAAQIKELNDIVLTFCIREVYALLKQHLTYIKNINEPRQIMDHSVNVSSAGNKTLMPRHFI